MDDPLFHKTQKPFPDHDLPEVIIEAEPDFAEFYRLAWQLAWDHVYESESLPHSPIFPKAAESTGSGSGTAVSWGCSAGMH